MPTCQYKYESDYPPIEWACNETSITNGKFCIFHDKDHCAEHAQEVVRRFEEKVSEGISQNKPLEFIGYYLPNIDFAKVFEEASFVGPVYLYFNGANFYNGADFSFTSFPEGDIDFSEAKFNEKINFFRAQFHGGASFFYTDFNVEADFSITHFKERTDYTACNFNGKANFSQAQFDRGTYFMVTGFKEPAVFSYAQFKEGASFNQAHFNVEANFLQAHFNGGTTHFSLAHFEHAEFFHADFEDEVEFFNAEFPSKDKKYHLFDWNNIITEGGQSKLVEFVNDILELNLGKENSRTEMSEDKKTISISWKEGTPSISTPAFLRYALVFEEEKLRAILKSVSKNNKNEKPYQFIAERNDDKSIKIYNEDIPIKFNHSTFRKRVQDFQVNRTNLWS